jgi:hypothetical protein
MSEKKQPKPTMGKLAQPNLQYLSNLTQNLPTDFQRYAMKSLIRQEISDGDYSSIDTGSPETRTFIHQHKSMSQMFRSPARSDVLSRLTEHYIEKKMAPHDPDISLKLSQANRPPASDSDQRLGQEPRTLFACQQNRASTRMTEDRKAIPSWSSNEISRAVFATQAEAIESLGPNCQLLRTGGYSTSVEEGWSVRVFACYDTKCRCEWLITSPVDNLASSPAYVLTKYNSDHMAHKPITWIQWYQYRVANNNSVWNKKLYKKQPGMPPTLKLRVTQYIGTATRACKSHCWKTLEYDLKDRHPLLQISSPGIRDVLKQQMNTLYDTVSLKNKLQMSDVPTRSIATFGDLSHFIINHRVDYDRLQELILHGKWKPHPFNTEAEAKNIALFLFELRVLKSPKMEHVVPHRSMIVLDSDEVTSNSHWKSLCGGLHARNITGPDPKGRTMVFTSIGLLGNLLAAQRHGWRVSCSTDGTHSVSNTKYTLVVFGVLGNNDKGTRSFFPVGYGWGEGEREIVALHTFINITIAVRKLFNVDNIHFRGGMISDHNPALVNALKKCFPGSVPLQCYSHIIRKFKLSGTRKGNGGYLKHLSGNNKPSFLNQAYKDITNLHHCKTKSQFMCYADLMQTGWTAAGEQAMAETFLRGYVDNDDYNHWWYTASGLPGCVPDNNPLESHNLQSKGGPAFPGYMQTGRNMWSTVSVEMPKLIYAATEARCNLAVEEPILNYGRMTADGVLYAFYREFSFDRNRRPYKDGFICCDIGHLNEDISDKDIADMEQSQKGIFELPYTERDLLVHRTKKFHVIKQICHLSETPLWVCDCYDYYVQKWCRISAAHQHRQMLELHAPQIPGVGGQGNAKKSKRQRDMELLRQSQREKRKTN